MDKNNQSSFRDVLVFLLLVAIGACGRWAQPDWCFTPIAAVTIFAGYYFDRWRIAVLVPVASLVVSDLALPAYDNAGVMAITYLAMAFPVVLGQLLRHSAGGTDVVLRCIICGLMPATLFYLTSNLAVWALKSNYDKTWAGLVECYWAALPFYRAMLAGDVFYLSVIFGCYALTRITVATERAPIALRRN